MLLFFLVDDVVSVVVVFVAIAIGIVIVVNKISGKDIPSIPTLYVNPINH